MKRRFLPAADKNIVVNTTMNKKAHNKNDLRDNLVDKLPSLYRFAVVLCKGNSYADDLVQATCERALVKWEQFQPGTRFESWLFAIMHSIWKNKLRREAIENKATEFLSHTNETVDGARITEGSIYFSQVLSLLKELPVEQSAALTLVSLEHHTYKEAAEILGIPQGTLESRVARGRIALGKLLEDQTDLLKTTKAKNKRTMI